MADITLAELGGNVWLVSGEDYIDDLLADALPPDITIEFVSCDSKSDVHRLWLANCDDPGSAADPWIIHPAIVSRIRRGNSPDFPVLFAQWSAMLDADAQHAVDAALDAALAGDAGAVVIAEYLSPQGSTMMADLSRLRRQMIHQRLADGGLDPERISSEIRDITDLPAAADDAQRLDIVIKKVS